MIQAAAVPASASGGSSIALAAMSETFIHNANAAGIPLVVIAVFYATGLV